MYATPAGGILWPVTMVLDWMDVRVDVLAFFVSGWKICPALMVLGREAHTICEGAMECIMPIAK